MAAPNLIAFESHIRMTRKIGLGASIACQSGCGYLKIFLNPTRRGTLRT